MQTRKVSGRFDRVFWLGDFNYRVEFLAEHIKEMINNKNYMVMLLIFLIKCINFLYKALLKFDQMQREVLKGKIFQGFEEGKITFNPTYKHAGNSGEYAYSLDDKKNPRIPSWTDRIL